MILNIKNKITSFLEKKYMLEILLLTNSLIGFVGWLYFSSIIIFIEILLGLSLLYLCNTFKYSYSFFGSVIFLYDGNFDYNTSFWIYLSALILMGIGLLIYIFTHKPKFKKLRMSWNLLAFSIMCFIPYFYSSLPEGKSYYVCYYLQWFLYLAIYFGASNLIQDDEDLSIPMCKSLASVGIILSLQCIYYCFIKNMDWYFLGWGHANYANMLIILFVPLVVYLIINEDKPYKIIYSCVLGLKLLGGYATSSRAFFVFLPFEIVLIVTLLFIKNKNKKGIIILYSSLLAFALLLLIIPATRNLIINKIIISENGDIDASRGQIYKRLINLIFESPRSALIGHGVFTWMEDFNTNGVDVASLKLCHNSILSIMVMSGFVGLGLFIWHLYIKYSLFKNDKSLFGGIIFISFLTNDIYGLIDNTYNTYFFMGMFILMYSTYEKFRLNQNKEIIIEK